MPHHARTGAGGGDHVIGRLEDLERGFVLHALADHVEANNLQGKLRFNLFIGASVGAETEDRWATLDMIDRRWPYQNGKNIAKGINAGRIRMGDKHLGHFAQDISYGFYTENGRYDIGIFEVSAVTEDGGLALTSSCGIVAEAIGLCDKIILEVNTGQPSFEGMHDIAMQQKPPNRAPFLITEAHTRIGTPYVPCDTEKVVAVVESKLRDKGRAFSDMDDTSEAIAGHIMEFFAHEVKRGRLPENLLPLQSGVGSIANAVVGGLAKGPFSNLSVYTEVLQDTMLDFFDGEMPEITDRGYLAADFDTPSLVIHGQNDETVDVQSARNLLDALTAAGRESGGLDRLPGVGNADPPHRRAGHAQQLPLLRYAGTLGG